MLPLKSLPPDGRPVTACRTSMVARNQTRRLSDDRVGDGTRFIDRPIVVWRIAPGRREASARTADAGK